MCGVTEKASPVFSSEHKVAVQGPIENLTGGNPEKGSSEGVGVPGKAVLLVCYALWLLLKIAQLGLLQVAQAGNSISSHDIASDTIARQ